MRRAASRRRRAATARHCGVRSDQFFLRDRGDRAMTVGSGRAAAAASTAAPSRADCSGRQCWQSTSRTALRSNAASSRSGDEVPEQRGLARSRQPGAGRRQGGRAPARRRGADARGDAGDRGLQPALRRASRALHDRDADVQFRHRDAEDHGGHLHPLRPPPGHRALRRAAPVHDRRQQARAQLPGQRQRRSRAARSARRRDRPRRRYSGAHRHGGRPGVARHLRARERLRRPARCPTRTSSRRSAARAT